MFNGTITTATTVDSRTTATQRLSRGTHVWVYTSPLLKLLLQQRRRP